LLAPFNGLPQNTPTLPRVGYLAATSSAESVDLLAAFRTGLRESGYVEGKNIAIEYRWANDKYDRLPALAADLARQHATVIAATSTPAAIAAKGATTTIPIVFTIGGDPVSVGLVSNLGRPDGNLTGVTRFNVELGPKRLAVLHEAVPTVATIALLLNPSNPSADTLSRSVQSAARALKLQLNVLYAGTESDFESVFEGMARQHIGALLIGNDPFFNSRSGRLAALTNRYSLPAIYQYRPFVAAGGLMSYGASNADSHRQLGAYVGRILDGRKPGDLPIQQSTKVELLVNLKTAKALGLTFPQSLLLRADEVIQ
jgi:putative ABC transport system substrate-binding protein